MLHGLGRALRDLEEWEEGEEVLLRALDIQRRAFSNDHRTVSITLNTYSGLLANAGRIEEAEAAYRETLEVTAAAIGTEHYGYAMVLLNLAITISRSDTPERAEPHFVEAVRLAGEALPPNHYRISLLEVATWQLSDERGTVRGSRADPADRLRDPRRDSR